MSTISSIGTASRNYLTVTSWLGSFVAGGWIGQCYNDATFNEAPSFSGHSVSGTNFITLTTGTGQSFADTNTNALTVNQTNGVLIANSATFTNVVTIAENFVTLQKLQIQNTDTQGESAVFNNTASLTSFLIDSCILFNTGNNGGNSVICELRSGKAINSVFISINAATKNGIVGPYGTETVVNCTVVKCSDVSGTGTGINTAAKVTNCAIFGWATTGSSISAGTNNASDQTISWGSANQASKTYTSQFVGTTVASQNFRTKTGAALLDNGATDTTDIPAAVDIFGTSRPQGSAWDIGAHELSSSSLIWWAPPLQRYSTMQ